MRDDSLFDFDPILSRLDPQTIQQRLGTLIRAYLHTRSRIIARVVVRHIDGLCCHPRFHASPEERCVYRRLGREWRVRAELA